MAVNLSVKGVPDDLAARLRERAARHHRSLQGELMAIIEQAASQPPDATTAVLAAPLRTATLVRNGALRIEEAGAQMRKLHPQMPASVPRAVDILRELRDRR